MPGKKKNTVVSTSPKTAKKEFVWILYYETADAVMFSVHKTKEGAAKKGKQYPDSQVSFGILNP